MGGIYGRNDFKHFVIYGRMCTYTRMYSSNCAYIDSIECVCSDDD